MESLKRYFKKGAQASDAIKSLKANLQRLEQNTNICSIREDIAIDFENIVECALDSNENKQKILRKFLKTPDDKPENALVFEILDKAHHFTGGAQRHMEQIISFVVQRDAGFEERGLRLLTAKLVEVYCGPEVSLPLAIIVGDCLKDIVKHEPCLRRVLGQANSRLIPTCLKICREQDFMRVTNSFSVLEALIFSNTKMGCVWLQENFDNFFGELLILAKTGPYVTRRQALKLSHEILSTREFVSTVTHDFLQSKTKLVTIMTLLRDENSSIQLEAFKIFSLFVAYPNKSSSVYRALFDNKARIQNFLKKFTPPMKKKNESAFFQRKCDVVFALGVMEQSPEDYETAHKKNNVRLLKSKPVAI